jgi:WD40 repeat protein
MLPMRRFVPLVGGEGEARRVVCAGDTVAGLFGKCEMRIWTNIAAAPIVSFAAAPPHCPVDAIGVSWDGKRAVTAAADATVCLWDSHTGIRTAILSVDPQARPDTFPRFSQVGFVRHDCAIITLVSGRSTIHCWDIETKKQIGLLSSAEPFMSFAVTSDGTELITTGGAVLQDAGFMAIWDLRMFKQIASVHPEAIHLRTSAVSPNKKRIATAGFVAPAIWLWDAERLRAGLQ